MEKIAISVPETAELLGLSLKTTYQLTHRADFPAVKLNGRTLVYVDGLKKWMRNQIAAKAATV